MIFVTVGTHHQPFERLIDAVEQLSARAEVVVQHGTARAPAGVRRAEAFLSFPEMLECFEAAHAVIMHAGVGSILCAANAGHTPIVVPRLREHGEHVDDHQAELIRGLDRSGYVLAVWDAAELEGALERVPPRRTPAERRPGPLHSEVAAALRG